MQKSNEKKVLALSAIAVITLIAVVVGATYAYFQAQGGGSSDIDASVITSTTDKLSFQVGNGINISASQENFALGMGNVTGSTTASAMLTANNATNTATRNYNLYLDIKNNGFTYTVDENTPELILTITDPDGTELESLSGYKYVTVGEVSGFDITEASNAILIADNYEITASPEVTQTWTITVTFINLDSDQNKNTGKTFAADVIIGEEKLATTLADVCTGGESLASCITSLYNERGEEGANGLYLHDGVGTYTNAAEEAGDNSYRYSGSNPNNFVCFGSDSAECENDNLYRIIGVFGNEVKLIKYDYANSNMLGTDGRDYAGAFSFITSIYKGSMELSTIAAYRWNYDTSVSTYGSNNWTTSEFNTINLNTNYWNYLGTTWQNLIAETTWHLGEMTSYNNTAKAFYDGERNNAGYGSNPTTYTDEIGLMYPSDYGYAASPDAWATNLGSYNNSTITANNWMYMGLTEWTITPVSSTSNHVFIVNYIGYLRTLSAYLGPSARPVFYLSSNVAYAGGTGEMNSPIRLSL